MTITSYPSRPKHHIRNLRTAISPVPLNPTPADGNAMHAAPDSPQPDLASGGTRGRQAHVVTTKHY